MPFTMALRNLRRNTTTNIDGPDSEPLLPMPMAGKVGIPRWRQIFLLPYRRRCSICSLRHMLILLVITPVILLLILLRNGIPPKFEDIRIYERELPQHNITEALFDELLSPPGRRRYLRVEGGVWGRGFNNVLQEVLHLSYLANRVGRSFVFEDYTWSHLPFPYTIYDFSLRPTRIPLNAYISGASSGGVVSADKSPSMRSVSLEFFDFVCPKEKRVVISSAGASMDTNRPGIELVEWWIEKLRQVEAEPCVVIDSTEKNTEVFGFVYFGGTQSLSVYPSLKDSPAISYFSWSPLVQSAVIRNFALLKPQDHRSLLDLSTIPVIDGLVAIHLRRGDFKGHCLYLHKYLAKYIGMNQYEGLLDKFEPSWDSKENKDYYMKHCLPTIDQIVERLHQIREENPSKKLKHVFLMSNGWGWWLSKLSKKLREDGWSEVTTSYDFELDAAQTQVSGAIDMAIAEKADVFVGNGFSSMTANIVMLRLAKGLELSSNRFL